MKKTCFTFALKYEETFPNPIFRIIKENVISSKNIVSKSNNRIFYHNTI